MEEMRVNPFGLKFLGPMPAQRLVMFHRVIYPMVTWMGFQRRFFPNWEVAEVVHIPLKDLLEPRNYACYRLVVSRGPGSGDLQGWQDFPCYVHQQGGGREVLWGATYRMVSAFLEVIFGFQSPGSAGLPIIEGSLAEDYFTSSP
jgi:hypothetical protein